MRTRDLPKNACDSEKRQRRGIRSASELGRTGGLSLRWDDKQELLPALALARSTVHYENTGAIIAFNRHR